VRSAHHVLRQYAERHRELGIDVTDLIGELPFEEDKECSGGAAEVDFDCYFDAADAPFERFAKSRHSVRHFDPDERVDPQVVRRAVEIALRAPSACNRQPWRVYPCYDRDLISRVMKLHNGSRGFGDALPCVLILASRMDTFSGPGERNQTFVDGGLFAMALMFSLHHLRIASVPLNWSVEPARDRRMKHVRGIPDDENIIMLLGIGHPKGRHRVPVSQRRDVAEVLMDGRPGAGREASDSA
jgi:nitroreductase